MSVRVPAEKNFRRSKVKPVKKRAAAAWLSWRTAATIAAAVIAIYTTYRATHLVLTASALQVRRISVHGNVRLSSGEVHALVKGLRGANILAADLDHYRVRLLQSPWVAQVAIRRVLPSTVEVFIAERQPVGLSRLDSQIYLIDRTGTIIDEFGPQYSAFDLPVIDGVVPPTRGTSPAIDAERVAFAARVLDALSGHTDLASRVSQVDVSEPRNAVVLLDGDTAFLHLGDDRFAERLQSYLELQATLRASVPEIDYVDLRFDPRIYVRPVGGKVEIAAKSLSAGN